MIDSNPPIRSVRAPTHLVASADQLATSAGLRILAGGGNAVDAAIATNAAIAVTGPHLCGMGGDLFALVCVDGEVHALNASGRAGSGADAAALRAEGRTEMPFRLDVRSVTVPGCVDGWVALHERFGSMPLDAVLEPARALAADGFPASPLLAASIHALGAAPSGNESRRQLAELAEQAQRSGRRVRRPGVAATLEAIGANGRSAFYEGPFAEGLLELGNGWFEPGDLTRSHADWQDALSADAFGVRLHTTGPNSQGYLALGAAALVDRLDLPNDPDDDAWAHLLIEASIAAARDRPDALHEGADGEELLDRIAGRLGEIDPETAGSSGAPTVAGDTTYLCTAGRDANGRTMAVSLIQSNASGFGSHLVEPATGINLHNRGLGFSVTEGHPAELRPGRRPPHTLLPMAATSPSGELIGVLGTMGGDAQPQIMLQLATRLFHHRQSPGRALAAGRWALRGAETGFDTWAGSARPNVTVEGHAPVGWVDSLAARGHRTVRTPAWDSGFGHAGAILVGRDDMWVGSADARTVIGTCAGG